MFHTTEAQTLHDNIVWRETVDENSAFDAVVAAAAETAIAEKTSEVINAKSLACDAEIQTEALHLAVSALTRIDVGVQTFGELSLCWDEFCQTEVSDRVADTKTSSVSVERMTADTSTQTPSKRQGRNADAGSVTEDGEPEVKHIGEESPQSFVRTDQMGNRWQFPTQSNYDVDIDSGVGVQTGDSNQYDIPGLRSNNMTQTIESSMSSRVVSTADVVDGQAQTIDDFWNGTAGSFSSAFVQTDVPDDDVIESRRSLTTAAQTNTTTESVSTHTERRSTTTMNGTLHEQTPTLENERDVNSETFRFQTKTQTTSCDVDDINVNVKSAEVFVDEDVDRTHESVDAEGKVTASQPLTQPLCNAYEHASQIVSTVNDDDEQGQTTTDDGDSDVDQSGTSWTRKSVDVVIRRTSSVTTDMTDIDEGPDSTSNDEKEDDTAAVNTSRDQLDVGRTSRDTDDVILRALADIRARLDAAPYSGIQVI